MLYQTYISNIPLKASLLLQLHSTLLAMSFLTQPHFACNIALEHNNVFPLPHNNKQQCSKLPPIMLPCSFRTQLVLIAPPSPKSAPA
jgi:hypothetical protein